VITYEFENVPIGCVEFLEKTQAGQARRAALAATRTGSPKRPSCATSASPPAPFRAVLDSAALAPALAEIGRPAVLKTLRPATTQGPSDDPRGSELSSLHRGLAAGR